MVMLFLASPIDPGYPLLRGWQRAGRSCTILCHTRFLNMRPGRILCSALFLATALAPCVAMTHTRRGPTSPTTKHSKPAAKKTTGQRSIDDSRATEIQSALVKSGYMTEPSGHWDSATESAMRKFQSDNGWQTKLMPDSRAIIKLGLGPSQPGTQGAQIGAESARALPETASTVDSK
jgi:peptidoglycan hydrolase-like protein with peptidoglycan-binding domain